MRCNRINIHFSIEGGCVKHIDGNDEDHQAPHLEQKICYCKDDLCNSAVGFQKNETNLYFTMSIIIFNLLLSALVQ